MCLTLNFAFLRLWYNSTMWLCFRKYNVFYGIYHNVSQDKCHVLYFPGGESPGRTKYDINELKWFGISAGYYQFCLLYLYYHGLISGTAWFCFEGDCYHIFKWGQIRKKSSLLSNYNSRTKNFYTTRWDELICISIKSWKFYWGRNSKTYTKIRENTSF